MHRIRTLPTHRALTMLLAGASLFFFAACGDSTSGGLEEPEVLPDPIAITVGAGLNPEYSWPGGDVFSVTVARTSDPLVPVWGLSTPGADGIESPVTHGTVPAGAVETFNTETTLNNGTDYTVTVSRIADRSLGAQEFTAAL